MSAPFSEVNKTASAEHQNYRADIDGLRALAVLAVVGFHAFPSWLKGGFIGVDIFFVISGYLISRIIYGQLNQASFRILEFYARRVRRIFPALLIVMISCLAFGWFALLADEYKQLGKHVLGGATFISNFLLWNESGYFDNTAETKPLLHLWSLGVEEQFYLCWPLFLWLAWRQRLSLLAISLLIASSSFLLNIATFRIDSVATFYSPQTRIWELLCGAMLAHFHMTQGTNSDTVTLTTPGQASSFSPSTLGRIGPFSADSFRSFLGAFFLIAGFLAVSKRSPFPGFIALLPVLGTVLLLSADERTWLNRKILASKPMVWVGLISFPLYLWHWPILSFLRIIDSDTPSLPVRGLAIAAALLLAQLTYLLIERPIRSRGGAPHAVKILCSLMVIAGLSGYAVYHAEGVGSRPAVKSFRQNQSQLLRTAEIDEACLVYAGSERPVFPYCRYTDAGGQKTVAVIGDSHAHTAYEGIARTLAEAGVNTVLFANSGCPPFVGAEYGASEHERNNCRRQIEQILRKVSDKKDIRDVLIFSRGAAYVTSQRSPGINSKTGGDGEPLIPPSVFESSLQNTVDLLQRAGKSVAYVAENPELLDSPRSCMPRPMRWEKKTCDVSLSDVMTRQKSYLTLLTQLKNVKVIHSLDSFCPHGTCRAFDANGNLLYADDNHLSVAGSRFQADTVLHSTLSLMQKP
ncbi:MAG: acyltransferase [Ramlibacter sp.]|nr:acyltransferase [Ramlibacter sp.]